MLLEVGNPEDNIEYNEEGRKAHQEDLVNSDCENSILYKYLITSKNPPQVAQLSSGLSSADWTGAAASGTGSQHTWSLRFKHLSNICFSHCHSI